MYGADPTTADSERTAFRRTEKRYKLYKPRPSKSRRQASSSPTDLSDVVDFHAILHSFEHGQGTPPGIAPLDCPGFDRPVFGFRDRPGFYFIPSALNVEEQCCWIRESLRIFPQPPNRTNLTAIYGPIRDIFDAAQNQKVLIENENFAASGEQDLNEKSKNLCVNRFLFCEGPEFNKRDCKSVAAKVLLRKLRWCTLGLQFDWSKRNYDLSLPHNKMPDALCLVAKKMAFPAMPSGEEFHPEAAIVNYYGPSDMLGGHIDDMEADWTKPIVSLSLGCKAIFLIGGKSREDTPTSMFLRSGDIVLMAGQARECFHGVPRIFTDTDHSEVSALTSQFSDEEDNCIVDYISCSRININIRQVN